MTPPNNTLQLTSTSRTSRSVGGLQLSVVLDGVRQEFVSVDSWKSGRSLPTAASWISAKSG